MVQLIEANPFVRKLTVTDYGLSSIEKTMLKKPLQLHQIGSKNVSRNRRSTKLLTRGCFRKRTCSKNDSSNDHKRGLFGY